MPSIGHVAVGLAAARLNQSPLVMSGNAWRVGLVGLALLPDADIVAFALGIPYSAPWGHRDAAHSLAFAGLCGLACAAAGRAWGGSSRRGGRYPSRRSERECSRLTV
jgi:inner membrane protein